MLRPVARLRFALANTPKSLRNSTIIFFYFYIRAMLIGIRPETPYQKATKNPATHGRQSVRGVSGWQVKPPHSQKRTTYVPTLLRDFTTIVGYV